MTAVVAISSRTDARKHRARGVCAAQSLGSRGAISPIAWNSRSNARRYRAGL